MIMNPVLSLAAVCVLRSWEAKNIIVRAHTYVTLTIDNCQKKIAVIYCKLIIYLKLFMFVEDACTRNAIRIYYPIDEQSVKIFVNCKISHTASNIRAHHRLVKAYISMRICNG